MRELLGGRLAPVTGTIGFLEAPLAAAVKGFLDWERPIHEPLGRSLSARPVSGTLEEALRALLPLTDTLRQRHLFVPTASRWCAFFDNGHQGTDAVSTMSGLAQRLGCRGARVTAIPDTIEGESRGAKGRYGALVLELYGPEPTHFLNYVRTIGAVNDGGRWSFAAAGTPLPFEECEAYGARRIRDRFTFDLLERYARALGLNPFDEDFYLPRPGAEAWLIEKQGAFPPQLRTFSLEALHRP